MRERAPGESSGGGTTTRVLISFRTLCLFDSWVHGDPIQSPVFAPDEVLQRLPPTSIQVGGYDPLLDDSVDFNTRIRRLGIPGELRIYRSLPHTFVSFPHWHLMPEVQEAMRQAEQWLEQWLWLQPARDE